MPNYGMLFVQGKDRPGIIQAVTQILYQAGANLEDVSMTLLEGQFAMMLSFQSPTDKLKILQQKTMALKKKPWNLTVDLISIAKKRVATESARKSILISAIGKDQTGIVHQLSSDLSKIHANITNLECRLLQRSKGSNLYSMALEIDLVRAADLKKIKVLIQKWQLKLSIEVKLQSSESAVF